MKNKDLLPGTVPFLNAAPLVGGLPFPLSRAYPRQLLTQLLNKDLDLALLSTSVLFEHSDLYLVPGMGIGCQGPVKSVKLFFNKDIITIQNIKIILLSPTSNSANQLARILFPNAQHLHAETADIEEMADGEIVIGDDALVHPDYFGSVDLGALWVERTGLPFVFAAWISRHPTLPRAVWQTLIETKTRNLSDLNRCLDHMHEPYPLSRAAQIDYLKNNIHYELGEAEMQGLARFREECAGAHPIQFAEIV